MSNTNHNPFSAKNQDILAGMQAPKSFTIFDDETKPDYKFKPLSNRNIRRVCAVWCNSKYASDDERLYYANLGEIQPDHVDKEKGTAQYNFSDTYDSQPAMYAALAQEMFVNFPTIVEVNDNKAEIVDPELSDRLLRDQVHAAFSSFLGKFGSIPYGAAALLTNLADGLSPATIGETILGRTFNKKDSKPTPNVGNEKSQPGSDGGNLSQSKPPKETPDDSPSSTSKPTA